MEGRVSVRNTNLDILKGISAYLVVIIHYGFPIGQPYANAISRVSVPLFLMISGYFCEGDWSEIKRKVLHLLKIFFVGELVYFVHYSYYNLECWGEWIKSYINVENIGYGVVYGNTKLFIVGWFLLGLCQMYLIYFLIKKYGMIKITYVLIPVLTIWNWLWPRLLAFEGADFLKLFDFKVLSVYPFFMLGNLWRKKEAEVRKLLSDKVIYAIIVLGIAITLVERHWLDKIGMERSFFLYVGTLILAVGSFAWAIYLPRAKQTSVLAYVGKNLSMYIYVLHILVIREVNIRIGFPEVPWIWAAVTGVAFVLYQLQELTHNFWEPRKGIYRKNKLEKKNPF